MTVLLKDTLSLSGQFSMASIYTGELQACAGCTLLVTAEEQPVMMYTDGWI